MSTRTRVPPDILSEEWDKSSQDHEITREFSIRSGRLNPSPGPGRISGGDQAREGDARNAQEREASMLNSTWRRSLAIGVFGVLGSALAFAAGAKVGSKLDHQTRTVSVAHVQIQQLQQPQQEPTQVANK